MLAFRNYSCPLAEMPCLYFPTSSSHLFLQGQCLILHVTFPDLAVPGDERCDSVLSKSTHWIQASCIHISAMLLGICAILGCFSLDSIGLLLRTYYSPGNVKPLRCLHSSVRAAMLPWCQKKPSGREELRKAKGPGAWGGSCPCAGTIHLGCRWTQE